MDDDEREPAAGTVMCSGCGRPEAECEVVTDHCGLSTYTYEPPPPEEAAEQAAREAVRRLAKKLAASITRHGGREMEAGENYVAYLRPEDDGRWSAEVWSWGRCHGRMFAESRDALTSELVVLYGA